MTRSGPKKILSQSEKRGQKKDRNFLNLRSARVKVQQNLNCPIQKKCGSCSYVNESYPILAARKYKLAVEKIGQSISLENVRCIPLELSPEVKGYRTSVKLAVRKSSVTGLIEIGLFSPGTHQIVSLEDCYIQHPEVNKVVVSLKTLLADSGLSVYDEQRHEGVLRYILVRVSRSTKELAITFVVTNRSSYSQLREVAKRLKELHPVACAFLNVNAEQTNRITGLFSKKLMGQDSIKENLCYFDLRVSPLSFFQVNPSLAGKIYARVEQLVGKTSRPGAVAWDLYCGIGIFSLVLMRQGYQVVGVEENPHALKDAQENAKRNFPSVVSCFKEEPVEKFIDSQTVSSGLFSKPEVVVVNPARTGLDVAVIEKLLETKKKSPSLELLYVSCEATTLTRDLKLLTEGGFTLRQLECFDMFPHTEKLEWLVILT